MTGSVFEQVLRRLRFRLVTIHTTRGFAFALAGAVVVLLIGGWLDLLVELPSSARLTTTLLAGIVTPLTVVGVVIVLIRRDRRALALAHHIDRAGNYDGIVVAGADLFFDRSNRLPLSRGFADLAVAHASSLAQRVPGAKVVPAQPAMRAAMILAGVVLFVAIAAWIVPRVVAVEFARFFDPFGDHPPYSRVVFTVDPGDVSVVYGAGFHVRVLASGAPVETMELALLPSGSPSEQVLRLFPASDGSWEVAVSSVTEPGDYWVRCSQGRSRRFHIGVKTVPRIETVVAHLTPPSYARQPESVGPPPPQGIAGLVGSKVKLTVESNRPLSGGSILLPGENAPTVSMSPVAELAEQVVGAFSLTRYGRVEIHVIDREGQRSADPYVLTVVVNPDERPLVRMIEPMTNSLATPNAVLPIAVEAEDDVGLERLDLYRSLNDSRATPKSLAVPPPPALRATSGVELSLATYGLVPGDEIKLFARVLDNDVAGAKGAESQVVTVRIISEEDLQRMVRMRESVESLQSKFQQAARRMESLDRDMEKLEQELKEAAAKNQPVEKLNERLAELAERLKEDAKAIAESAEKELPYEIDHRLSAELKALATQLQKAAEQAQGMAKSADPGNSGAIEKQLAQLRQQMTRNKQDFDEKVMAPLEHLAHVYPLYEDQARFVELYQRQRSLAERAASLKGKERPDDPAVKSRMRDLEAEQRRLEDDLAALLDKIEADVEKLPDAPHLDSLRTTATEFVSQVRASGVRDVMVAASTGFEAFSGTRGAEESRKAADILEQFLKKCSGIGKACKNCPPTFSPSLSSCLGQSMEQMLADAGLKQGTGSGQGSGAGDGYSAVRSTLENTGIYGGPTTASAARRGGSSDRPSARKRFQPGGSIAADSQATASSVQASATTVPESAIPSAYRRRVADYFRRVAEELGSQRNKP